VLLPHSALLATQRDAKTDGLGLCLALDGYFLLMAGVLLPLFVLARLERRERHAYAALQQGAAGSVGSNDGGSGDQPAGAVLPWGAPGCSSFWELYMCSCFAWYAVRSLQAAQHLLHGMLDGRHGADCTSTSASLV
jgi:hypothetical protein